MKFMYRLTIVIIFFVDMRWVHYTNNSLDTLKYLWFHLWPNAYSGSNTAMNRQKLEDDDASLNYARQEELGWIDSLDFFDASTPLDFKIGYRNPDLAKVELIRPIQTERKTGIQNSI